MKIPAIIKIGAARYRVKIEADCFVATGAKNGGADNLGESISSQRLIRVATHDGKARFPEESIADTLLHEVIHSISRVFGIGLTECQTNGLAGGLMSVIRDNKLNFLDRGSEMPLPRGTRVRVKTTKSGKKVRLAFGAGGKVIEAKNLGSGATHTPAEFRVDRKRAKVKRGK